MLPSRGPSMCIMWGDILRWAERGGRTPVFLPPLSSFSKLCLLVCLYKPVMYLSLCTYYSNTLLALCQSVAHFWHSISRLLRKYTADFISDCEVLNQTRLDQSYLASPWHSEPAFKEESHHLDSRSRRRRHLSRDRDRASNQECGLLDEPQNQPSDKSRVSRLNNITPTPIRISF